MQIGVNAKTIPNFVDDNFGTRKFDRAFGMQISAKVPTIAFIE
jgi:hypothetical protein